MPSAAVAMAHFCWHYILNVNMRKKSNCLLNLQKKNSKKENNTDTLDRNSTPYILYTEFSAQFLKGHKNNKEK